MCEISFVADPSKLTAVHSGEWLSRRYETPRWPFSKLCSSLLCAYGWNKRGPSKARLRVLSITQLRAWAHRRSAYAQLSPLYLLSTLHVTHMIKYTRSSTAFPYFKRQKAGRGLGTRLNTLYAFLEIFLVGPYRWCSDQWRSQNTADARAQRGHTTFASSLVPRPRPALSRLQYGMQKQLGGGLRDAPPENFGIFELHRSILRLL